MTDTLPHEPQIKFCGLTRREDAEAARELGASYGGVIFAGGPRHIGAAQAAEVLSAVRPPMKKVGVFGAQAVSEIVATAAELALDVVQLHGDSDPDRVTAVKSQFRGEVWAVVRLQSSALPENFKPLAAAADAIVVDSFVRGVLGGSGIALDWNALARTLAPVREGVRIVLAGGLRPNNVREAIDALHPDIVDVSSGVETGPGMKDHALLRAFRDAVMGVPTST